MNRTLRSLSSLFLDITETIVIGLSLFLVVYLFFLQPHQVSGQSMVPNFQSGDYVLTDKVSYRFGEPQRGEVIVFHAPESAHCPEGTGCDFIKRVIAVPGEQFEIRADGVYINGILLDETYLPDDFVTEAGAATRGKVLTMGPDEYMAIGDNRPFSSDSRAWGPIQKSDIVGRAFFRYWPADSMEVIPEINYALDSN